MITNKIKQLIFNNCCLLCEDKRLSKVIPFICDKCLSIFNNNLDNICKVCSHPLDEFGNCQSCNKLEKIYYDSYKFIQYYTDYLKKIIFLLKLKENFMINRLFFELLILKKTINNNGFITVVPDTFLKKIKKGRSSLNYLLYLFKKKGYKTINNIYKKKFVLEKSQKKKTEKKRIKQVANLFYLPEKNNNRFKGKIYLIDDIYTTGSTLNYGARLLKEAGFDEVNIVSFFRAKMDRY